MRSMATARRGPPENDPSAKDSKAGAGGKSGRGGLPGGRIAGWGRTVLHSPKNRAIVRPLRGWARNNGPGGKEKHPSGGCSSVGRVLDCDSSCRGFESHQPPQRIRWKRHGKGTYAKAECLFSLREGPAPQAPTSPIPWSSQTLLMLARHAACHRELAGGYEPGQ
jgi:hypothetical protein